MGRPEYKPSETDRFDVHQWALGGVSQESIAETLGISSPTLRKYFREELNLGTVRWKVNFESSVGRRVLDPDCPPALVIFTLKAKCGWREMTALDPSKEAKPEELSSDDLRARIAARVRELRDGPGTVGPVGRTRARRSA